MMASIYEMINATIVNDTIEYDDPRLVMDDNTKSILNAMAKQIIDENVIGFKIHISSDPIPFDIRIGFMPAVFSDGIKYFTTDLMGLEKDVHISFDGDKKYWYYIKLSRCF